MASDMDLGFEALFARIRSPQTAKRFKLLRYATTEDLARTFQREGAECSEQKKLSELRVDYAKANL